MSLTALFSKLAELPDRLIDVVRPSKPQDFLLAQPPSISELLPYETVIELAGRPTCLLSDASLGLVWELSPMAHEVLETTEMARRANALADIFNSVRAPAAAFQIIYDSEPSPDFEVPANLVEPSSVAEKIMAARVASIRAMSEKPRDRMRLMRRRVFLTLRLAAGRGVTDQLRLEPGASQMGSELARLEALAKELVEVAEVVEQGLVLAKIPARPLDGSGLLSLLRESLHGLDERRELATLAKEEPRYGRRLGAQVMRGFTEVTPSAVGVGSDSWEVCSWIDQPPVVHAGLWTHLVEIDIPHRLVVNIRPCLDVADLGFKAGLLKNATDAFGELQREEVRAAQDAMARGDILTWVSVHLFVRNEGVDPRAMGTGGKARSLVSWLRATTQVPFIVERHAAPALFLLSLPLCFSASAAGFSGRERRVLSRNLGPYLPLYGAFAGTRTPYQLMTSRGGSAIWLNPFDGESNAHVAILAGSGSGKSFYGQNLMVSHLARFSRSEKPPLIFIVDKKTSYAIFAAVMGEEVGARIIVPPREYPNIFRGQLDEFRLPVIVALLETAVSLVSTETKLDAVDEVLITESVRKAFEQNELDARTEYRGGELRTKPVEQVRIPRLSHVVDNLHLVAAESGIDRAVATALSQSFAPFIGSGPYAALFDREEMDALDPSTPGISLYDIDAVSSNPVLSTLTTQMVLAEIVRQVRRPENVGRPGMLVIEEVGVLAGSSPELVAFIQEAWKTFRKLNFSCVGLTNEVDDYARKAGPREIWNVSPNKVILRMLEKDLHKAVNGAPDLGIAPLIEDRHLGAVIGTLQKRDGAYSQGLWWSDETKGTFVFHPTGFDYWCAASKPIEVETVHAVKARLGTTFFRAVAALAQRFPSGVRAADGTLRVLGEDEFAELIQLAGEAS